MGLNRVHLLRERFGFLPSCCVAMDVVSQIRYIGLDLEALAIPKFVNWAGRRYVTQEATYFLRSLFAPHFSTDIARGVYGGHSVTFAALQVVFHLGFSRVILVGKDHSYAIQGIPCTPIVSDGEEKNHFASGYYESGQIWRIPDYKGEEFAYSMAKEAFERAGREVLDATVGGHLDIFRKVPLDVALK